MELRNRILLAELVVIEWARVARRRVQDAVRNEDGQTPTEYLMIVGLMAAAIVTIFVTFFWGTVKDAASTWADKVKNAVLGNDMQ